MMSRMLLLVSGTLMCATLAYNQPVTCVDDNQCHVDHFCDGALCRECLRCEDFKRDSKTTECVKYVSECGSCLKGLVAGSRGSAEGADSQCVIPETAGESLPVYIYVVAVLIIVAGVIGLALAAVYVCRKKDNVRISVGAFLPSYCTPARMNASAPEPPPPYNQEYTAVRPESPGLNWNSPQLANEQEGSYPLVKRAPGERPSADREAEANQNANGYSPPHYIRLPGQMDSNPPIEEDSNNPDYQDESTMPHDWSPNASTDDANGNTPVAEANATASTTATATATPQSAAAKSETAINLSDTIAQARDTTLVVPPPKKLRRSDSNNNGNRDTTNASERGDAGASAAGASAAPAPPAGALAPNITLNIMVNQRNNNFQLH